MSAALRLACLVSLGSLACVSVAACRGAARVSTSAPDGTASAIRYPLDRTAPSARVDLTKTAPGPRLPFHVAARGSYDRFGKGPPLMELCPIDGRTFVCGERQLLTVEGDAVRYEPQFEAGLRGADGKLAGKGVGVIEETAGRWPDDAWLVVVDMNMNPGKDHFFYHWGGSSWSRVATVNSDFRPRVAPYGGGVLVEYETIRDTSEDKGGEGPPSVRHIEVIGSSGRRSPPRLDAFRRERALDGAAWQVTPDGVVFAVSRDAAYDKPLRVERLGAGSSASIVDRLADATGSVELVASSSHDTTAYGRLGHGAFLSHFDGNRWTTEEAPPKAEELSSYAKTTDGIEWAVAGTMDGEHSSLWRRSPGEAWQAVRVPGIDAKGGSADAMPREVWAVGPEAWALVWENPGDEPRPTLLRMGPVATEWVAASP